MPTQDTTPAHPEPSMDAETFAAAWDAMSERARRRRAAQELARQGPATIERRFDLLTLGDGSIWRQDGERVTLEVPALKHLPPANDTAGDVPGAETADAVARAREGALGLRPRPLWAFQGTAAELIAHIAGDQ